MRQGAASPETVPAHTLNCVADCGIVMPVPLEGYASILILAAVIAAVWIAMRRIRRHKRRGG